jgi:hypothetical protein
MPVKNKLKKNARSRKGGAKGKGNRAADQQDEHFEAQLNLKMQNQTVVDAVERNVVSAAVQVPLSGLADTTNIDIKLKKNVIHTLKGQTLMFELHNTTTASIALPKWGPVDMLKYINLKCNNGSDLIQQISRENLLFPLRYMDKEDLDLIKTGFVCDDGEVIAANGKRTFYLPLFDVLVLNEVFLAGIKNELTYELYFDPSVWSGSVPSLTKCQMISRHLRYDTVEFNEMMGRYSALEQSFRYRDLVDQNWTQTLDPSVQYEFLTTQFNAPGSEVIIQVMEAGDKVADWVQYVDSYDIEDQGGQSILGSEPMSAMYHKIVLNAAHGINSVVSANNDPWLIIPLSPSGAQDLLHGSVSGVYDFTSNEKLIFKTKSTLSTGAYKIKISYAKLRLMTIDGGHISVM